MKKQNSFSFSVFLFTLFATAITAAAQGPDLSNLQQAVESSKDSFIGIAKPVLYLIGAAVIGMGIYDLFIDEDVQKQGAKAKGVLKIIGGGLIIGLISIVDLIAGN